MSIESTSITPSNTRIVLIDHQPGVMAMVKSVPADELTANVAILARLGEELEIPLLISSTRENLEFLGTTIGAIQHAAPVAYEKRVRRAGTLNAFLDAKFVAAVKALNRPNLVMAGVLTESACGTAPSPPSRRATTCRWSLTPVGRRARSPTT